jgi:hypothetical protein
MARPDDGLRDAIQNKRKFWIASAYAQGRFGGLQARHSSRKPSDGGSSFVLLAMTG